jgi:hypothetical protein
LSLLGQGVVASDLRPVARLAAKQISQERPGQALDCCAGCTKPICRWWNVDRQTLEQPPLFIAAATQALRRILVERAPARCSLRTGGRRQRVILDDLEVVSQERVR